MPQHSVSLNLPRAASPALRAKLASRGFSTAAAPDHAEWQVRGGGAVVTSYTSGKLLVQAPEPGEVVALAQGLGAVIAKWAAPDGMNGSLPPAGPAAPSPRPVAHDGVAPRAAAAPAGPFAAAVAKLPQPAPNAWIGVDECGKGDYFGPLIIAAARVERAQLPLLAELGVADSKSLSDNRVKELAKELKAVVPFKRILLMPPRYNELYAKTKNLNRLLAWGHAAAAEALLEAGTTAELILSDQFAKADLISGRLKERGRTLRFTQRTKAEEDPAVACASIFARAEFLFRLAELERQHGVALHKGASSPVVAAARKIVATRGAELLGEVAKLHFKTTEQAVRGRS